MAGTPLLIADDYALTPGVSRGILRLIEAGRLSGAGAMVTTPHWKGFSEAFRGCAGKAQLGLHLNLTLGAPLTRMARHAPDNRFPTIGETAKRALSFRIPVDEVAAEIRAQLNAFERAMDRPPDFVDGHQHVHALPGVRAALLRALCARYPAGTKRPWLRDPADRPGRILARGHHLTKAFAVAALAAGFGWQARRRGFETNDGFSGFSAFDPEADVAEDLRRACIALGPRHVVMCHPGEVDDELRMLDPASDSRPVELAVLMRAGWR